MKAINEICENLISEVEHGYLTSQEAILVLEYVFNNIDEFWQD